MADTKQQENDLFQVMFLCTGNRARSVIAEAAFRRLAEGRPFEVRSAGVLDLGPKPALPEAAEAALRFGLDLSGHQSRCLTNADLGSADLVIGFQRDHIAAAVVDGGADAESTFLMLELLRLLRQMQTPRTDATTRELLQQAHALRTNNPSFHPNEEIADPIGGKPAVFRDVAEQVVDACEELAERLGLVEGPT